jgi:hypothetical protein
MKSLYTVVVASHIEQICPAKRFTSGMVEKSAYSTGWGSSSVGWKEQSSSGKRRNPTLVASLQSHNVALKAVKGQEIARTKTNTTNNLHNIQNYLRVHLF